MSPALTAALATAIMRPITLALADGRYPHAKTFHILVRPEAVAHFVTFLRSPDALPMLKALGQQQIAK